MMQDRMYHKVLRVSAVVVALVLVFDSGLLLPVTKQLSDNTINYLASATSVTLSVPENELNVITTALMERERELDAREAVLNERTIGSRSFSSGTSQTDYSTYILSSILFLLTSLIVLNYVMDFVRARNSTYETRTT